MRPFAPSWTASSRQAPDRDDEVGADVRVEHFRLDNISNIGRWSFLDVDAIMSGGEIRQSMTDSTTLTVEILDPEDDFLKSGIFDTRVDVTLDGIPFRLVTVERGDDGVHTLEFEHRLVAYFREHTKPRKFSRGKYTRAEAAKILVSEVKKAGPIRFVSPSLHRKQPIAAADGSTKASAGAPAGAILNEGDSLAVGSADYLHDIISRVSTRAAVGRTSSQGVSDLQSVGSLPPTLVIQLGTNDTSVSTFGDNIDTILGMSGVQKVYWVNIARPSLGGTTAGELNDVLESKARAHAELEIIDWKAAVDSGKADLGGDSIHPTAQGYKYRANLIASALRRSSGSTSRSTSVGTRAEKDAAREEGFSDSTDVKVNGKTARRAQLKNIDIALGVARDLNAGARATKAMVCAGIGESEFKAVMNAAGSGYGGVFQGDVEAKYRYFHKDDTAEMARCFLKGGKGFQGGGAIALAKQGLDVGEIATRVEASGQPGTFYGRYAEEADAIIEAWGGGGESFGGGGTYYKRFEFTRGQPEKRENTWETLQRWANDVRWRVFIVGKSTVYFAHDDDLMKSRARYTITPDTEGVTSVRFKLEVGKRTVARKGRRDPKPSTMTIRARIERWAAPPGTVIEVEGYGQADGRWLVDTITRPIFDAEGTIELRQPQKQLPEPRSETATRRPSDIEGAGDDGGGGGGEGVNAVYEAALMISQKKYPYAWGGGHGRAGHPSRSIRPGETQIGYDCSGYTAACLKAGGMLPSGWESGVPASGTFASSWGEPGEGEHLTVWANGIHVWIEFVTRKARADTSRNTTGGEEGPRVRPMPRQTAGFTPRHWKGGAPTRSHPMGSAVSKHRSGN